MSITNIQELEKEVLYRQSDSVSSTIKGIETSNTSQKELSFEVIPNPFEFEAQLSIHIPTEQQISMNLFDQMGRLVQTIVPMQTRAAGQYTFNLRNEQG